MRIHILHTMRANMGHVHARVDLVPPPVNALTRRIGLIPVGGWELLIGPIVPIVPACEERVQGGDRRGH